MRSELELCVKLVPAFFWSAQTLDGDQDASEITFMQRLVMTTRPGFSALFAASPYPYLLIDIDFVIIGANPAYLREQV
ncbi:hypothetical protein CR105_25695 [Massilia eurypsychrophila]|uniref:Uncharacterized protein n=1 Tax=Massilia eurypsychrophila TaxID=1485217 RepID=A0A2G8T886_9BURK|nr:hypothetical protein [Massilia eurypsychrophila]PIL42199.1 hypothetical protein CR105_25695 [Massilia eurypsychrophila]